MLNEKGGLITTKGHTCVSSDPNGEVTLWSITIIIVIYIILAIILLLQNFPWYVNTLTKFTSDDLAESAPARLIWFVHSSLKKEAYKVLGPLAKEYISKKAEENMKVKLMFFIADEENEASEAIRSFAHLQSEVPQLAILDIAHKQVRQTLNCPACT